MRRSLILAAVGVLGGAAVAAAQAPAAPLPLSLGDAVRKAAGATPAVQLAKLQVDQAEGRLKEARSSLLPRLNASAGWLDRSYNLKTMGLELPTPPGATPLPDLVGPFGTYDARLSVTQTLLDAPSLFRMKAAGAAVETTDAQRQATVEAAAQQAALDYLKAARAAAVVSARREDVALARQLEELAQTETQAGVGTAIDVTRAKTQRVTAEGLLQVAENEAEQAQMALARALGMDPDTRFVLTDSLLELDKQADLPQDAAAAVRTALQRRPELDAVDAAAETASEAKRSIQLERLPRLQLFADYGSSGTRVGDGLGTGQVGLQLSLPILDGFGREARLEEQDAAVRSATVRKADLRQQVEAEVKAALLDLRSGVQQTQIAAERLDLAQQEVAQAKERFANGVAGNIEVIDAQSSLIKARDADIDARYATAVARANLARAEGVARTIHN